MKKMGLRFYGSGTPTFWLGLKILVRALFIVLGFNETQPLWVILCRLREKGRKDIGVIVEEMKEKDGEETGTGMKVKKQKK